MARRVDHDLADSLPDIEGTLDRAARWVGENPAAFLIGVGAVLLVTGGVSLTRWWAERSEIASAEAVAAVRSGYLKAMGAPAGATTIPEPANPETARKAREEFAAKFADVAEAHDGRAAAVEAWIEAGNLRDQLGQPDAAVEAWKRAVEEAPRDGALRGLALERLASGYEGQNALREAAAAREEAANIQAYPLRFFAMADAARTYALANEPVRATALADRVAAEAPDLELPDALAARMSELRAAHAPVPSIVPAPGIDTPVEKPEAPAPKAEEPAPKP
jgi:tetratricopeptide (TPR) repeat protein